MPCCENYLQLDSMDSNEQEAYTNHAVLTIEPKPDSVLRVFMVYQKLEAPVEVSEMEIMPFKREGFTVIEWGGCELIN